MSKTDTLIVNLFGGPGLGKSTTSAGLFCLLKMHKVECELVTEFAKDLVWEERYNTLRNQQYIFGKQYHKIWRLLGKVKVIITDSPLLLSIVYNPDLPVNSFVDNVVDTVNTLNNLNIILNRNNEYNKNGRLQSNEQAKNIDKLIKQKLLLYNMEWISTQSDHDGINSLACSILNRLDKSNLKYHIGIRRCNG